MSEQRLIHYSKEPLLSVYSREHDDYRGGAYKTPGLWISVEGEYDWISWCRSEHWEMERFVCATQVILKSDHNVLWLKTPGEIDKFTHEFVKNTGTRREDVQWKEVRNKWQGLIIAPYQWERRLSPNSFWYYGWDCASGVIWDHQAVEELKVLPPPDMTVKEEERYG